MIIKDLFIKERAELLLRRFLIWRIKNISQKNFIRYLSVIIGFVVGIAAVMLKYAVHFTKQITELDIVQNYVYFLYFLFPMIGIGAVIIFYKFIMKSRFTEGVPSVLYALSKTQGKLPRRNMFTSFIASSITVGFGGSVGLEGPVVSTGAAIGSNIGQMLRLDYKQLIILLGAASAAAMASIFKAPIAAVVFAMEVIMIDLTAASVIPLLLASTSAAVTSMFFLGVGTVYTVKFTESYELIELPYYILLGIASGLLSVYFTFMHTNISGYFKKKANPWKRLAIAGLLLGILIFVFPSLYGEGFEAINMGLNGSSEHIFQGTLYHSFSSYYILLLGLILLVILFKVIATSLTFGAGGVGGIFAPSLFLGSHLGLLFALTFNYLGFVHLNTVHFAFSGMAGLIAGVFHAPLTGIFLIADITGGYQMFIPLILVSVFSFVTVKLFYKDSIYNAKLVERGELMTHNSDQNILKMMSIEKVIETNFIPVQKHQTLGDLVKVIAVSKRNVFPVVDSDNNFEGIVVMDQIREIMFDRSKYQNTTVEDLMFIPHVSVELTDKMDDVANKFHETGKYNLPVLDQGQYIGFVSRANVFSTYRRMLKHFSND